MTSDLTTKAAEIRAGLVAELRERTAFRFAGDCKCGKCQLVPRTLVNEAADLIEQQAAELAEARAENERYEEMVKHEQEAAIHWCGEAAKLNERATTAESERDELLREKERLGAGWRDISTAPKDGTKIRLAWSPDDWTTAEGLYREGEWFAAPLFYRDGKSKPGMMYLEFREYRVTPIYWMPLSPPPESSGRNLADANSKSPAPSSQSERIAVLEAALRPFAKAADDSDILDDLRIGVVKEDHDIWESSAAMSITFGNLRDARSALDPLAEGSTQNIGNNLSEDGQHLSSAGERSATNG